MNHIATAEPSASGELLPPHHGGSDGGEDGGEDGGGDGSGGNSPSGRVPEQRLLSPRSWPRDGGGSGRFLWFSSNVSGFSIQGLYIGEEAAQEG